MQAVAVAGYASHEREVLRVVVEARSTALGGLRRHEYFEIDPAGREVGPPRVETGH